MQFRIISFGSPEHEQARDLRDEVLRKPLGLRLEENEWRHDKDAIIIAGFEEKKLLATCMLIPHRMQMQMRQVAVSPALQGKGVGSAMMLFCEEHARTLGLTEIYAHARCTALAYYERNGYIPEGEEFLEQGIPHIMVRKKL